MENNTKIPQNLKDRGITELKSVDHEGYDDILKQRQKLILKYFYKPELRYKKIEHLKSVDYYVEIYKDQQWTGEFVKTFPHTSVLIDKSTIKQLKKGLEIGQQYDFYLLTRGFYIDTIDEYNHLTDKLDNSIRFNLGTKLNDEFLEFGCKFSIIDSKPHMCINVYSHKLKTLLHIGDRGCEIPIPQTFKVDVKYSDKTPIQLIFESGVKYLEDNYEKIIDSYNGILDNFNKYKFQPNECEYIKFVLSQYKSKFNSK